MKVDIEAEPQKALGLLTLTRGEAASVMANFAAWLKDRPRINSFNTVKLYVWAATSLIDELNGPNVRHDYFLAKVMKCLRRIMGPTKRKKAVTKWFLMELKKNLDLESEAGVNMWAAIMTAYHALLRSSEYVAKRRPDGTTSATLRDSDITIAHGGGRDQPATAMDVTIRMSKTDTSGEGETVSVAATGGPLCPVEAVASMRALFPKQDENGPAFFGAKSGKALSYNEVAKALKKTAEKLEGAEPEDVGTHSLRAAGASEMAAQGIPEWVIKKKGRWASACFMIYCRNTYQYGEEVARALQAMGGGSRAEGPITVTAAEPSGRARWFHDATFEFAPTEEETVECMAALKLC